MENTKRRRNFCKKRKRGVGFNLIDFLEATAALAPAPSEILNFIEGLETAIIKAKEHEYPIYIGISDIERSVSFEIQEAIWKRLKDEEKVLRKSRKKDS